jgi:pimeloyl-ACP methyl ester carboxylesterase
MKKYLFILSTLFACTQLTAQRITGNWLGLLPVNGQNIRLIFHIRSENGQYTSTFDSPDQYALGLPVNKTTIVGDSVLLDIPVARGGYSGKWDGANTIKGNLRQDAVLGSLTLERMPDSIQTPKSKPQTPKPPFDYFIEEVAYENTTQQVHLAGSFTRPKGDLKFPVVLMITGSGPQDRDESMGQHKPFWVIADYLTRQGIAVLRVDDRGMGKSGGDFRKSSSADFATDVMAGIDYLKTRKDIDTNKIGLIGHSEGGTIAIYTAARRKDLAFMVSLAGPATTGAAINDFQAIVAMRDAGLPQPLTDALLDLQRSLRTAAITAANDSLYRESIRSAYLEWKTKLDPATAQVLIRQDEQSAIAEALEKYMGFRSSWWKFFVTYDPVPDITKISIPVLVLNGGKDAQVEPKANLSAWGDALKKSTSPHYKTVEIEGLNHLFQHCRNCSSVAEYMQLEESFDPATLQIIGDWLKSVVF